VLAPTERDSATFKQLCRPKPEPDVQPTLLRFCAADDRLAITLEMLVRIRRLHSGNKSEREVARIPGLSRNTVAKWLRWEADGPPKYRRWTACTRPE